MPIRGLLTTCLVFSGLSALVYQVLWTRLLGFAFGTTTVSMPARTAPRIFSFTPPMGRTRPESVISPVIATSCRTGIPERVLINAVAMVTPADGPSLGIAPAGT